MARSRRNRANERAIAGVALSVVALWVVTSTAPRTACAAEELGAGTDPLVDDAPAPNPYQPPPMRPFKRGFVIEGAVGVYAPIGRLKRYSSPGPLTRIAVGYDITRWLGVFGAGDVAYLSTDRASPPPGERAYLLWGFTGQVRLAINLGDRLRVPLRIELGAHKTDDNGVLATYGFTSAKSFGISYGATTGLEWRALSRHFGVLLEAGLRSDDALRHSVKAQAPLALVAVLGLHYTL